MSVLAVPIYAWNQLKILEIIERGDEIGFHRELEVGVKLRKQESVNHWNHALLLILLLFTKSLTNFLTREQHSLVFCDNISLTHSSLPLSPCPLSFPLHLYELFLISVAMPSKGPSIWSQNLGYFKFVFRLLNSYKIYKFLILRTMFSNLMVSNGVHLISI